MARPAKIGVPYFPADVDMFQDRKIKRLLRSVSTKGFTIYLYLLTEIYREEGYFYRWDEHSAFDISDDLHLTESAVEETVKACCAIGLFNKDMYTNMSVLTSASIQERWQKIVTDANRKVTEILPELDLLSGFTGFLVEETPKSPGKVHKEKKRIV